MKNIRNMIDLTDLIDLNIRNYCSCLIERNGLYKSGGQINNRLDYEREYTKYKEFIEKMVRWYNMVYLFGLDVSASFDEFKKNLSKEELFFLPDYKYPRIIWVKDDDMFLHLGVNDSGMVEESILTTENINKYNSFKGMDLSQVLEALHALKIELPMNNELEEEIEKSRQADDLREQTLNSVMLLLLEYNGPKDGPKMAYNFAENFSCDKSIALKYALNTEDISILLSLLRTYLRTEQEVNFDCYINYYTTRNKNECQMISLEAIIWLLHEYMLKHPIFNMQDIQKFMKEAIDKIVELHAMDTVEQLVKKKKIHENNTI